MFSKSYQTPEEKQAFVNMMYEKHGLVPCGDSFINARIFEIKILEMLIMDNPWLAEAAIDFFRLEEFFKESWRLNTEVD